MPPEGKHWQYTPDKLDEMDAKGDIYWSSNGNPRRKVYLDESRGIPVQDIWLDYPDIDNQNTCITGYPTEKNIDMVKRIINASSNPNDIVMDCFAGSGTTLVAAEETGRQWIGVDSSDEAIKTMRRRFAHGTAKMGDYVKKRDQQPSLFCCGAEVCDGDDAGSGIVYDFFEELPKSVETCPSQPEKAS